MKSRLDKNSWILTTPAAHRGLHNSVIPENSMAAFKNAIEKGHPIETDVHMTTDGRLVCFHDDSLERMTGYKSDIRENDYKTLKSLRLKDSDERIPDFEEFLELAGGKVPLLIEIKKQKRKGIEPLVKKALEGYKGEYAIQSFDPFVIINYKKIAPDVLRGQLACGYPPPEYSKITKYVLKHTPFNFIGKPDFVNYDIRSLPTKKSNYSGLPLICWTVRTVEEQKKAQELGINYVFENVFQ